MLCPFAFEPDPNVQFNYYQVREGTALHSSITGYLQKCSEFVDHAKQLVSKYNADSAFLYEYTDVRKIIGLNFTDEAAPLDWKIVRNFGCFAPDPNAAEHKDFQATLPYFWDAFPTPFPLVLEGARYTLLNTAVVIALTPNKDGTACRLSDAYLLKEDSLNSLKIGANAEQLRSFDALHQPDWIPFPIANTNVFTPSKEVEKQTKVRADADSLDILLKYSPTSRKLKAAFSLVF